MRKRILLRGARQLVTLRGPAGPRRGSAMRELAIIEDGALLICGKTIEQVGPGRRVENLAAARDAVEISADGRIVLPGFVDARTHLICGPPLLDEYEARLRNPGGSADLLERLAGPMRVVRSSTRPRLEMLGRRAAREFIRHGTTTVAALSGLGLDEKAELKVLRAANALHNRPLEVVVSFFGANVAPPEGARAPGVYLTHLADSVLPKIRRLKLARFVDVRVGDGGFPPEPAVAYLEAARRLGFAPKVTAGEGDAGAAARAALSAGAVSLDGPGEFAADDVERLAAGPVVTLTPGVCFHLMRERRTPARALIDAGAAVALASGYSAHECPSCSMPAILSLACAENGMHPAEAVTAATINGAWAIGQGERIGSLEAGKQADLIMLNAADYREIPYHFGMNLVAMVMKAGSVIYPRMEFP